MYEISSSFDFQDILHLLKNHKDLMLGKFAYEKNIPSECLLKNFTGRIKGLMSKNIIRLGLCTAKQIEGLVLIKQADWDSEHFGLNMGRLELALFNSGIEVEGRQYLFQKIKEEAASQNLDVISIRIGLNQFSTIQALEKLGAISTDFLLNFCINPKCKVKPVTLSSSEKVVKASEKDEEALVEISRKIFEINHFYADPYLPKNRCADLYSKWISNSLNETGCNVLVAKNGEEVTGFITFKIENVAKGYSYGVIDLVGVKNEHTRKGVGRLLVTKALEWFSNYTNSVYVGTSAANISAIRLYESVGFKQVFPQVTLHLWIHANKRGIASALNSEVGKL